MSAYVSEEKAMSRNRAVRWVAAGVVSLIVGVAALGASERRPLPPLTLQSLDGQAVELSALARDGNWLLIYVEPSCGSCTAILSAMPAEEYPGLAERVTVIVGGASLEQAAALAQASELATARWVLNPDKSARAALNIKQAPSTIGVRSTMMEWTLTGVLRRSAEMTSVLVSWLKQSRPLPPVPGAR
jgi:hypothetical protein